MRIKTITTALLVTAAIITGCSIGTQVSSAPQPQPATTVQSPPAGQDPAKRDIIAIIAQGKTPEITLPPSVKYELGDFDGPMEHMMVFREGSLTLMSSGPTYRSIIKITNTGSEPSSLVLDIDDSTKKEILRLAREKTGQYWQFEPAVVELAAEEKKDVILFVGLNTGRWSRLSAEDQAKFKAVCSTVKLTKVSPQDK